jgi:hypothetical protein
MLMDADTQPTTENFTSASVDATGRRKTNEDVAPLSTAIETKPRATSVANMSPHPEAVSYIIFSSLLTSIEPRSSQAVQTV